MTYDDVSVNTSRMEQKEHFYVYFQSISFNACTRVATFCSNSSSENLGSLVAAQMAQTAVHATVMEICAMAAIRARERYFMFLTEKLALA